jgi:hypothetical protein
MKVDAPSRCGTRRPLRKLHTTNRYFQKTSRRVAGGHEISRAYDTFRSWKLRLLFLMLIRMGSSLTVNSAKGDAR